MADALLKIKWADEFAPAPILGTTKLITDTGDGSYTTVADLKTFVLAGTVTSVAGRTGAVVLGINDITNLTSTLGKKADLDNNGILLESQLPATALRGLRYIGAWNASTNTPTLTNGTPAQTETYYIVSVAGTALGNIFDIGDWVVNSGGTWGKLDRTDGVISVNGKQGVVVIGIADISGLQGTLDLKANTSAIPTKLPNPFGLTLQVGGVTQTTHDGSVASTFNVPIAGGGTIPIIEITNFDTFNPSINAVTSALAVGQFCNFYTNNLTTGYPLYMGNATPFVGQIIKESPSRYVIKVTRANPLISTTSTYPHAVYAVSAARTYDATGNTYLWYYGSEYTYRLSADKGYTKYPDGTMEQWGQVLDVSPAVQTVGFSLSFLNTNYSLFFDASEKGTSNPLTTGDQRIIGSFRMIRRYVNAAGWGESLTSITNWRAFGRWY